MGPGGEGLRAAVDGSGGWGDRGVVSSARGRLKHQGLVAPGWKWRST